MSDLTDFTLASAERRAIVRAMREADGVKTVAAKLLGCGKSTLYRKLREHAVDVTEYLVLQTEQAPPLAAGAAVERPPDWPG